jgi:hypothetical protein
MDFGTVEMLRERHPAWRLLRAGNASLAVRPCDTISYGRDDPPAPAHSVLPIVEAD